jgi:hypothetical protein
MKHNILLIVITLLACLYACNNDEKPTTTTVVEKSTIEAPVSNSKKAASSTEPPAESISVKGRWLNTSDKNEEWEFTDSYLKMYYEGKMVSEEKYGINNKCATGETLAEEAEKYISTHDGLCYYIAKMDASNLELSLVGRGNTLSFTKAK